MASFSHLIRFQSDDGKTYYGDLTKEVPTREIEGSEVEVLEGDVARGFQKSGSKAKVEKLLCPLPTTNIVLCVGLNYRRHAEECNVSPSTISNPQKTSATWHIPPAAVYIRPAISPEP
jgi:transcription initiation factor TFIIH subunit 2